MADSYQKACPPGSVATIADLVTTVGGAAVSIRNMHADQVLYITGNSTNTLHSLAFPIAGGRTFSCVLNGDETIYGFSAVSTVTISAAVFRTNFKGVGHVGS